MGDNTEMGTLAVRPYARAGRSADPPADPTRRRRGRELPGRAHSQPSAKNVVILDAENPRVYCRIYRAAKESNALCVADRQ
jgi:hypothetical protein